MSPAGWFRLRNGEKADGNPWGATTLEWQTPQTPPKHGNWGPDLPAVFVLLLSWAAFCASAGLLLGSLADTEGQASGLGVLLSNALAALGGCWWPIEITPGWMQSLQNFMPTGWAMDGLHRLVNFEAGPGAAVAPVLTLLAATGIVAFMAARRFRFA